MRLKRSVDTKSRNPVIRLGFRVKGLGIKGLGLRVKGLGFSQFSAKLEESSGIHVAGGCVKV